MPLFDGVIAARAISAAVKVRYILLYNIRIAMGADHTCS